MAKFKKKKDPVKKADSTAKFVGESIATGIPIAKKRRAKRRANAVDSVSGAGRRAVRPKLGDSPGLSDHAMSQAAQKREKAKELKAKGKNK